MAVRVMVLAGGTGGHVFPALAVAQWLIAEGHSVTWMGTQRGIEARVVPETGIEIDWLSVSGVRGKGKLAVLLAPLMVIKACMQAASILRRRKPQVILGMGGFAAGPGGLMGRMLRIPLVIHEQNRVPGTTNRLLMKIASVVLEAFPRSFAADVRARATGNPLRSAFCADWPDRQPHERKRLLILGGSLGAAALNEVVPQALAKLPAQALPEVIHQSGEKTLQLAQQQYEQAGVEAQIKAFIDDMPSVYRWADLVICRAGAMTISELAATETPAILVPLPNAIDDHQTRNAEFLADADAAVLLRQSDMNVQSLSQLLAELLADDARLAQMSKAAAGQARLDATEKVAGVCLEAAA